MKEYKNIPYKRVETRDLFLDIFLPEDKNPPLIMWIHGGGWKELNRTWNLAIPLLEKGYAVAEVDYRYCDEGEFPTQMLDLKDALLFLRRNADKYGYDGGKIAVSGDSAGAHLCTLMGVSAGNRDWETAEEDYRIQAVVDMCGPTELAMSFLGKGEEPDNPIAELLGAPVSSKTGLGRASAASPMTYINGSEPPFLILHGSEDPVVYPEHSRLLRNALEKAGVPVMMYLIPGAVHAFGGRLVTDIIGEFLDYYLKGIKTVETPEVKECHMRKIPYVRK
ncbi:MAG: alpha/beta hydrolase [Bacillota bacterium]|nr:alpha/beta hydrolase [Bacillota bacterium]